MTGLMQSTSIQREALCIIAACYGKFVQNPVSCIMHAEWHSSYHTRLKDKENKNKPLFRHPCARPASVNHTTRLHS